MNYWLHLSILKRAEINLIFLVIIWYELFQHWLPLFMCLLNQILVAAIFNLPSFQARASPSDVDLTLPIIAFCST